jgi:hypothetical protein
MKRLWGRSSPEDSDAANRAYLTQLAQAAGGDLSEALQLALGGLDPAQRVAFARGIVDGLPAVMRAAILGDAVLGVDGWTQMKATMTAEERRPKVVRALLERGRKTRTLDFSHVPEGADVVIDCYRESAVQGRTPYGVRKSNDTPIRTIELRARGSGVFVTQSEIGGIDIGGDGLYIPPRKLVTVGSVTPEDAHKPVVEYGDVLSLGLDDHVPVSLETINVASSRVWPVVVGSIILDHQLVFE